MPRARHRRARLARPRRCLTRPSTTVPASAIGGYHHAYTRAPHARPQARSAIAQSAEFRRFRHDLGRPRQIIGAVLVLDLIAGADESELRGSTASPDRLKGHTGAHTWAAWAILAYNLDTLALRTA